MIADNLNNRTTDGSAFSKGAAIQPAERTPH